MEVTREQASDIVWQIQQNQWKWLKVKQFSPENYATANERYAALEKHHAEETARMIEIITGLCQTIASLA